MEQNSPHIIILCSRLDLPGGIERAVVNTANLFAENNNKVTLLVLDNTGKSFYPIDKKVNQIIQPATFGIQSNGNTFSRKIKMLQDIRELSKNLKSLKPSLVIASEYQLAVAAILAGASKWSRVVSWEHHHKNELKVNLFWQKLIGFTYPKLNSVVCLNDDEQALFKPINANVVIIPNFIKPSNTISTVLNKRILTVGRITNVKGIDLLLDAAKIIAAKYPDWHWKLIGAADDDEKFKAKLAKKIQQSTVVIQQPNNHDLQAEYAAASIYVMTSRHECFPMTLLEAQSAGLPCVAFDCETGPRHIVKQNENGYLVDSENIKELADAICMLIENEEKRKSMSSAAQKNIEQYSSEKIYEKWKKLFL